MALNPIDLLRDRVTPQIIDQPGHEASSKSALLDQFYPVLLAYFSHQPNAYDFALANSNATFSDILPKQTANASMNQLLEEYSRHHNLPISSVEPLLNSSVHLSAQALHNDAMATGVPAHLQRYLSVIVSAIPAWAIAPLSTLGLAALFSPHANAAAAAIPPQGDNKAMPVDGRTNDLKRLIPWIMLILFLLLLLLFWRSCQHKEPLPVVADATTANNGIGFVPASIALTSGTGSNLLACNANSGDAGLAAVISNASMRIFGNQPLCNVRVDQAYSNLLPAQDKIEGIFTLVKAIPYASIVWTGNQVVVNAPNPDDINRLVDAIRNIAPELSVMAAPPLNIDESVNSSITAAQNALSMLRGQIRPEDVARALNLQIINFATDSATIPEQNKPVLDQAAALIRQTPNIALVVEGYTDSTGDAAYNKTLSQKRAQSVIDYLMSHGVTANKLSAMGFGQFNPVADNVTELGKFRNRRIEFRVTNTQTGITQHVDEGSAVTSTAEQNTIVRYNAPVNVTNTMPSTPTVTANSIDNNVVASNNGRSTNAMSNSGINPNSVSNNSTSNNAIDTTVTNDGDTTIIANGKGSAPVNP